MQEGIVGLYLVHTSNIIMIVLLDHACTHACMHTYEITRKSKMTTERTAPTYIRKIKQCCCCSMFSHWYCICMSVCVCVCVRACVRACVCTCVCLCLCLCLCVPVPVCVHLLLLVALHIASCVLFCLLYGCNKVYIPPSLILLQENRVCKGGRSCTRTEIFAHKVVNFVHHSSPYHYDWIISIMQKLI